MCARDLKGASNASNDRFDWDRLPAGPSVKLLLELPRFSEARRQDLQCLLHRVLLLLYSGFRHAVQSESPGTSFSLAARKIENSNDLAAHHAENVDCASEAINDMSRDLRKDS